MNETTKYEKFVDQMYHRYQATARAYFYSFSRTGVTLAGTPCALFLGNHSSGKSSLINALLDQRPIQETGVAPTDDCFTVICYAEKEEDVLGPAALLRLPSEFALFNTFGPNFLQHLKVKFRTHPFLKKVTLIDSPGMIDTTAPDVMRGYPFASVVAQFAQICDLIFYLFDPDKPGTTGETVDVLAQSLQGLDYKLWVLLNKCDLLQSTFDFARAYGTLCWNLAHVLTTKDLPKIFTTYTGDEISPTHARFDFSDFNRHRKEVMHLLLDASARRADHVVASARSDFEGLLVRLHLLDSVAHHIFKWRLLSTVFILSFMALLIFASDQLALFCSRAHPTANLICASVFALLCALILVGISHVLLTRTRRLWAHELDLRFEKEFQRELLSGVSESLRAAYLKTKSQTQTLIERARLPLRLFAAWRQNRLARGLQKLSELKK